MCQICGRRISFEDTEPIFRDVIFVLWDDGPAIGAARCVGCDDSFRFDMLAADYAGEYETTCWDAGRELRIFSLAPLPRLTFERLAAVLPELPEGGRSADEVALKLAESILAEADEPVVAVATHGIRTPIIRARRMTARDVVGVEDWFQFVGISRDSA